VRGTPGNRRSYRDHRRHRSDVVIITASSLVNGTIDDLLRYAAGARGVGFYGPSASIIPDALFEQGADFILSHRVHDPERFVEALMSDIDIESALRKYQRQQTMLPASPYTSGCKVTSRG
jgi:uncharacterized protein (DUF4213/DUF364 family)